MKSTSNFENKAIIMSKLARRATVAGALFLLLVVDSMGQLTADFTANITSVCSGFTVVFTDNSSGTSDTTEYEWDFGAGASPATATGIGPHSVVYTGSTPATISLTITDSTSNTMTKVGYITVNDQPATPAVTVTDNCDGTSTLATLAAGTLLWSTSETTPSIIVSTAGDYTVTTTVNGCTSLPGSGTAAPKTAPATPVVTVVDNCNGTSTLSTTATGTLLWSNGQTTSSINVTTAGTYTVTTTVNGCISSAGSGTAAPKTAPATPVVTVVDNCNGTSTLSTTATGTLLWSNGQTTSSINVTTAGTYTVTTTVNGCISSAGSGTAAPKTAPATPVVTVVDNCNGTSTLSTTATGTLLWSTGQTTSSINVTSAGTYTVTTTVNGCISPAGSGTAAPKTAPATPMVTVVENCNGTTTLSTTATGTLLWSTGQNTSSINVTIAGTYTVTTTVNGCISSAGSGTAAPKMAPAPPVVTVVDNCNGTSTLSTTATGTLLWNTGQATSSIIVPLAGTYTVTTTVNGCTSTAGSGIASPKSAPQAPDHSIDCTLGHGQGIIEILAPLGTGLVYRLDGGTYQTGTTFNQVANGSHIITVRNSAGCITIGESFEVACQCVDGATVNLSSTSGSTCGITPITITGNTFGGKATMVTITTNGSGSISPSISITSPFSFTYTPESDDIGEVVQITVTTNNPPGAPCVEAVATYNLDVVPNPATPVVGNIVQPSCAIPTGTVNLNGLPSNGEWTLIRNPGGIAINGSGTSITIPGLLPGTYTYAVRNVSGCVSPSSGNVIIAERPPNPSPPIVGTITQPSCNISTGSVVLTGLPAGSWTINPGGRTGTTSTTTISGLLAGTYTYTVTNAIGCTSEPSSPIVINLQPGSPSPPIVGTITNPTCLLATGSVVLSGLPSTGTWVLTRYPGTITTTGTGSSSIISGLSSGIHNFTVTNASGCVSIPSLNVVISAQPLIPAAPLVGSITPPTCEVPTGSVALNGLPATGTWTLTRNPGGVNTTGSGSTYLITGLPVGTYTFTVTGTSGCISPPTSPVIIPVQPGMPVVVITDPTPVCSPSTVNITLPSITVGSTPGLIYTYWSNSLGTVTFPTPEAATSGTYYIKGTSAAGCSDIKEVHVVVDQKPIADAGPDQILDYQFSTTLNATLTDDFESGVWTVISGKGIFDDQANPKTGVGGMVLDKNEFLWTVTRGNCPPVGDTVLITVRKLDIQTLITPNMDGRNDYFIVKGLESLGKSELNVFDRWGTLVFRDVDYDNLWNGVDFNSNPLPDDTYFYRVIPEKGSNISGFIVIRR
jgi:large repetitive protein